MPHRTGLLRYVACVVFTFAITQVGQATCTAETSDIFIWSVMADSFPNCGPYVDKVRDLAEGWTPPVHVHAIFEENLYSPPVAYGDSIVAGLDQCRTVWIMAHGLAFSGRPVMVPFGAKEATVDDWRAGLSSAARNYLEKVWVYDDPRGDYYDLYSVALSAAGMAALGAGGFDSRLVIGSYCYSACPSAVLALGFGIGENAGCEDDVLVGYPDVTNTGVVDVDTPTLIDGMTCGLWDFYSVNATLAAASDYGRTHPGEISAKLEAHGCTGNQMLPCWKDCRSWASGLSAHVSANSAHVLVQNEESSDALVVRAGSRELS